MLAMIRTYHTRYRNWPTYSAIQIETGFTPFGPDGVILNLIRQGSILETIESAQYYGGSTIEPRGSIRVRLPLGDLLPTVHVDPLPIPRQVHRRIDSDASAS